MKILHVSCGEVYGGIETILASLARHAGECPGLAHEFALCFEGRLSGELEALAAPVHRLGAARIGRPASVLRARGRLRTLLGRGAFDIAVCHGPRSMVIAGPAARDEGVPLAMWAHGVNRRHRWLLWLLSRVPPDLAICCSRYTQQALESVFPKVDSTVVHAPVAARTTSRDSAAIAATRDRLGARPGDTVVVQVSRMVPSKGQRVLIESLAEVESTAPWQCWIVGGAQAPSETAYLRDLETAVGTLGLAHRIRFLGHRSDVEAILDAADIFCQPNLTPDAFGITFVEAMMAGLPVVTSAFGGALEVVDAASGVLLPPNDRGALQRALKRLLDDPAYRRRVSNAGPARARVLCDPAARLAELHEVLRRFERVT